jgi:hypothetical protein
MATTQNVWRPVARSASGKVTHTPTHTHTHTHTERERERGGCQMRCDRGGRQVQVQVGPPVGRPAHRGSSLPTPAADGRPAPPRGTDVGAGPCQPPPPPPASGSAARSRPCYPICPHRTHAPQHQREGAGGERDPRRTQASRAELNRTHSSMAMPSPSKSSSSSSSSGAKPCSQRSQPTCPNTHPPTHPPTHPHAMRAHHPTYRLARPLAVRTYSYPRAHLSLPVHTHARTLPHAQHSHSSAQQCQPLPSHRVRDACAAAEAQQLVFKNGCHVAAPPKLPRHLPAHPRP